MPSPDGGALTTRPRRHSKIQVEKDPQLQVAPSSLQVAQNNGQRSGSWTSDGQLSLTCGAAPINAVGPASPTPAGRLVISLPISSTDLDNTPQFCASGAPGAHHNQQQQQQQQHQHQIDHGLIPNPTDAPTPPVANDALTGPPQHCPTLDAPATATATATSQYVPLLKGAAAKLSADGPSSVATVVAEARARATEMVLMAAPRGETTVDTAPAASKEMRGTRYCLDSTATFHDANGALQPVQADERTPCADCNCGMSRAASPPPAACVGCTCGLAERADSVKAHRAAMAEASAARTLSQPPHASTDVRNARGDGSEHRIDAARSPDAENMQPPPPPAAAAAFGSNAITTVLSTVSAAHEALSSIALPHASAAASAGSASSSAPPASESPAMPSVLCDACDACDDVCNNLACKPCDVTSNLILNRKCKKGKAIFTMCQVARHNTAKTCWIVANKTVYDCTSFLAAGKHPGGNNAILQKGGKDCSTDFKFHSKGGRRLWAKMIVGKIVQCPRERCKRKETRKPWNPLSW